MRLVDVRRIPRPTAISASATRAKIHNGRPVKGKRDEAIVPPSRVVVPSTPPDAFVLVGRRVTAAPFTPPADAGLAAVGAALPAGADATCALPATPPPDAAGEELEAASAADDADSVELDDATALQPLLKIACPSAFQFSENAWPLNVNGGT